MVAVVFNLDKEHFGDIEYASEEKDKTFFRQKKFETRSNLRFLWFDDRMYK